MTTYETLQVADAHKMVHLVVPVEEANRRYHFIVLMQPISEKNALPEVPVRDWPPGFFEATAGKWVGDFERPPQGEFETREEL
ncbi:MAG: hypothetical protein EXS16_16865 [Gemmataceae bacterium]|nr:hypothetical protein [Gemmataceae bacterium]